MSVDPIPQGYHSVTPYLVVDGADEAIRFYTRAFGAEEVMRLPAGDKIGHAEIRIGNSMIMLSDEWPDQDMLGPKRRGGPTGLLMIYTEDCDAMYARAVEAGAAPVRPLEDQFYGDRSGSVRDPFGHQWTIATHVEDVPEDEIQRRMKAWTESQAG